MTCRHIVTRLGLLAGSTIGLAHAGSATPHFEPVQAALFAAPGAQSVSWADYDNDGDLDLAVTFKNRPNRLYKNNDGEFTDVAGQVGWHRNVDDARVLAWGDYNGDGHLDLYVGYGKDTKTRNRLYRNNGDGKLFTDVAAEVGLDLTGTTRQSSWVDYDNDGDLDIYICMRDRYNYLFRNDAGKFTDVSRSSGLRDPRRSVGAVWFDMDSDGDLDVFLANQNGDRDGFYRNDNGRFTDIAASLDMDRPRRPLNVGSTGVGVADYDNDGDLDLFVATYANNLLYRNDGGGQFVEVAASQGLDGDFHGVGVDWGDYDNDGRIDLYVNAYLSGVFAEQDYLYRNTGKGFEDVLPPDKNALIRRRDADHGTRWGDFDGDGDLDLALASNHKRGTHQLYRNQLPDDLARRSLRVSLRDQQGRFARPGSEVRLYDSATGKLLATRMVDTGSGYCSQSNTPLHFGLASMAPVTVEVTRLTAKGREVTRFENVNPADYSGQVYRPL
ncbi:CRTAC1 family protein [Porticoccus sp. W117]|uniref:CRTAC1 family protein n=1 Tax=Porticoccus sp. W117 TaxID=3054777 RepID=UPI0025923F15|nr:CRTAC1 family protein [Porticoccus sp. W117]MDM3870828.1 CRTAC1 family protein [Porticoccus sp. W117]